MLSADNSRWVAYNRGTLRKEFWVVCLNFSVRFQGI